MRVHTFLMYYDRFKDATTSKMLDFEHTVLCHENADKFECIGEHGRLVETREPKGIQKNFNYALNHTSAGDWLVFMSDDLKNGARLEGSKFVKCPVAEVLAEFYALIEKADQAGVKLLGMNSTGNALYAQKKYSKYGLIDGRCFAIKNTDFRFDTRISTIPDYYATAFHLKKYGGNLILNTHYLDFERYKSGGLGSVEERLEQKRADCALMVQLFPKNCAYKDKKGEPEKSHIVIKKG